MPVDRSQPAEDSRANRKVVVIGGGISGLSAAYDLTRAGVDCTLIEKRPRVGGVIETRVADGCTLDCGPDGFLAAKPEALALIKEVGLADEVIGSNDHIRTTYIWKGGGLVPLPEGVMMIVPSKAMPIIKSSLLGWGTKIRMGLEYFRKPDAKSGKDRSVAEFVTDHFGRETLDYLAEPLLSGVYGGDVSLLSVGAVLPRFLQMEAKSGSLVKATLASQAAARAAKAAAVKGQGSGASPQGAGTTFQTLKSGLGKLTDTLSAQVAAHGTICHADVQTIEPRQGGGFRLKLGDPNGSWMEADQIVIACPAWAASQLTQTLDPKMSELLSGIGYSSSVTVSLIYKESDFDGRRAGFGFLIPKVERQRLAACTFVGTKYPYRTPEDRIAVRCFFGGAGDSGVLDESDEALVAMAREELRRMIGLKAAPISHVISRWPKAMAQYYVGHQQRVAEIRAHAAKIPGLYLAGNAYEGIGIPDCIRTGRQAAKNIIGSIQ